VGSNKSVSQALGLNIPSYADAALDAMEFPPGEVSQENLRYFELKTIYDRVLAGILLVILSPVLLICMIAIRVNSPGNPIFSQRRTGTGGKTFTMYKLRSMYRNAEQKSGPQWSQPGDARVTVVGRFLRFSHLDEIPQLFNVLRGEMALVGPRPERPSIVKELIPLVPGYEKRHAVRPGITGLAQIYLPPDEDLKSVKAKVVYDLIYIRYAGFAMDVRIAVCTVLRMVGIRGGLGPQWTGLSRRVDAIRDLNRQRAAQRRGIERPQGVAAVAGEQRIQRLNQVEQGFSSKDSGITSLIGDSAAPAKTKRATTQSSSAEEPRRATENRPTKKRPRPISNSKPR
jgi:lipopolysaccharide/colanic/teichoic acid biosynthesis glycosyltransferase